MLQPVVYNHKTRYAGYGIKFWPRECEPLAKPEIYLRWLKEAYKWDEV